MADPDVVNAILNPRKNAEFAIADDLVPPLHTTQIRLSTTRTCGISDAPASERETIREERVFGRRHRPTVGSQGGCVFL